MSFWDTSTGENLAATQQTGSYESSTAMEPIPDGTVATSMPTEVKWDEHEGKRHIKIRWDVIDGEYKGRVIFQKIQVAEPDIKKRDKALRMLAAIDANAGAGLLQLTGEPSDMDLSRLCNRPMSLRLRIWELDDKSKSGNWVEAVAPVGGGAMQSANSAAPASVQQADQVMALDTGNRPDW